MNNIDRLVRSRAWMLIFVAFSFGLWQFSGIGKGIAESLGSNWFRTAGLLEVVGSVLWLVASYLLMSFSKKVNKAQAFAAMNDELVQSNRAQSASASYWVILGLLWALIAMIQFWQFDVASAVRVIATIGVMTPMVYFSMLELKNNSEAEA